jgi:Domain of unknown function (DUF5655)
VSWTCPECARTFARAKQSHKCGTWTVEQHLEGADERALDLYRRFVAIVEQSGPYEFAPTANQIGIRGERRIFAGVKLTKRGLEGYLDLPRHVENPAFHHVSPYTKKLSVHHFVVERPEQLEGEFADYVRESHAVGRGEA